MLHALRYCDCDLPLTMCDFITLRFRVAQQEQLEEAPSAQAEIPSLTNGALTFTYDMMVYV